VSSHRSLVTVAIVTLWIVTAAPAAARAQGGGASQTGAIEGRVTDA